MRKSPVLAQPGWAKRIGLATAAAVALALSHVSAAAPAANAAQLPPPNGTASSSPIGDVAEPQGGPTSDDAALAEAADNYDPGDLSGAAQLADTATTLESVALHPAITGATAATSVGTVSIDSGGEITLAAEGVPDVGIKVDGDPDRVAVVDGAVVQTGVAPSTDVVTRASDNGVQLVAILGDEQAPSEIAFPLDLPEDATLQPQNDGSIDVFAPVETEEPLPGEEARLDAEIGRILGPSILSGLTDDDLHISAAQWAALEAVPEAQTRTVEEDQLIGTIGAPWAVDANGDPVDTRYVIEDGGIKQVLETDENTAFPVVADPAWWVVAATAVACAAQLSGFLFAVAKFVGIVAKVTKLIKASSALTKAVNKVGGVKAVFTNLYNAAKGWIKGNATKYISATKLRELKDVVTRGKALVFDAVGIGSCGALLFM
jgi:hypothetical protein